ncbi:MAG: hypothetical protein IJ220_05295 [Clostridia bacterium]|nr:hypothetical protein [Clostridia bacterium]
MEIKKCTKCGAFIMSENDICTSCSKEIAYENTVLKNYFDENVSFDSIPSISAVTGIAPNVIQNYMKKNNYIDYDIEMNNSFNNIQY